MDPRESENAPGIFEGPMLDRTARLYARLKSAVAERLAADRLNESEGGRAMEVIERALGDALAHAAGELGRRREKASGELERGVEAIERASGERLAAVEASERMRLESEEARCRRHIERAETKAKEAVWLADTVLESALPKHRQAFEALAGELRRGVGQVELLEQESLALAEATGVKVGGIGGGVGEGGEVEGGFAEALGRVRDDARAMGREWAGRLVRSGVPFVVLPLVVAGAGVGVGLATGWASWQASAGAALAAGALGAGMVLPLVVTARRRARAIAQRVARGAAAAREVAARTEREASEARDAAIAALHAQRDREVASAKHAGEEACRNAVREREERVRAAKEESERAAREIRERAALERGTIEARVRAYVREAEARHGEEARAAEETAERARSRERARAEASASAARARWGEGVGAVQRAAREVMERMRGLGTALTPGMALGAADGSDGCVTGAMVGRLRVEPAALWPELAGRAELCAEIGIAGELPVGLEFPGRGSLLVRAPASGRGAAVRLVQGAMLRILTSLPPGRAKFVLFDPIGRGQSFAGFMRLADADESLVGGRVWTEAKHLEQRLADLTEHVENVIQKYLRDDFASIEEYNRQAGEIAEAYRFLVVADYPHNISEEAAVRLASLIDCGARCGVHVIVFAEGGATGGSRSVGGVGGVGGAIAGMGERAVVVEADAAGVFRVQGVSDLELTVEEPAGEEVMAAIVERVGAEAVRSSRVEVAYGLLAPAAGAEWTGSCAAELRIPIGRAGANKLQELRLGRGTSQHALIAGRTGSGKSTLLHVLVTTGMLWFSPAEVEFYLVDFKKGVEFKAYAMDGLPHVRAVAVESDREFGLSVLQRLDQELKRRGDLFRTTGVQSLEHFRERSGGEAMPRTLLMIDEFQEFFVEDDRVAQESALLLDRLVRQGRAFGIHVLLASQTLSGAYSLARSTVGQMAVRIALRCSEADSYLILSEDNGAARLLSRAGEAIYNDANGLVEGNNPFQVAWLSDAERTARLREVRELARARGIRGEAPILFEGHAAADVGRNELLRRAAGSGEMPAAATAWVGEPVSIKAPTGAVMRRRGGADLLIVGQQEESARAMLSCAALSLACQHGAGGGGATFVVLDPGADEEGGDAVGGLGGMLAAFPHGVRVAGWRGVGEELAWVEAELAAREEANRSDGSAVYVIVQGLHRFRALRRSEDDFSFGGETKATTPDAMFRRIVREGAPAGVFVLCWVDTASSLQRSLDRQSIGEFSSRVLMQMSGADSSMLIESVTASKLGLYRAIFFDEERGEEEKFRPYGMPSAELVRDLAALVRGSLGGRHAARE